MGQRTGLPAKLHLKGRPAASDSQAHGVQGDKAGVLEEIESSEKE